MSLAEVRICGRQHSYNQARISNRDDARRQARRLIATTQCRRSTIMKKLGKGCLIVVGVVFILGVIGAVLGSGSRSNGSGAPKPTAAAINAVAQPARASATSTAPDA